MNALVRNAEGDKRRPDVDRCGAEKRHVRAAASLHGNLDDRRGEAQAPRSNRVEFVEDDVVETDKIGQIDRRGRHADDTTGAKASRQPIPVLR